jgi:putative ABC transport system permease protein
MQALYQVSPLLANTDLEYESYLTGIGRQLFYLVAGSYITLYLGVLFLIIANTVLGLKFLMQQRSTRHRYETLFMLGASEDALCSSARTQIRVYFALVIGVAVISAVFGVWSMFNSVLTVQSSSNISTIVVTVGIAALVFLLIEFCYIGIIQSESDKEIRRMNSMNGG